MPLATRSIRAHPTHRLSPRTVATGAGRHDQLADFVNRGRSRFLMTVETTLDLGDVAFRRLGPGDASAVRDLHAALDEHDSYYRFFGPRPKHLEHLAAATASNDPGHGAVG